MTTQFLRVAELTADNSPEGIVSAESRVWSGLRMRFKIDKTSQSAANKAVISIYNLRENSRAFFEEENIFVSLKAGYPENIAQIFQGNVIRPTSKRQPPDWVTDLECGDGEKKLKENHIDKSWGKNTSWLSIIQQGISALGLSLGPQAIPVTDLATQGFSFSGQCKDMLDQIIGPFGLEWSVQDGTVQITQNGQPTAETAVVISPTTGLVENIIKNKAGDGIIFKTLLNPQLKPGRAVQVVNSGEINGFFKCRKVVYEGDTHEGPWFATVEAEPIT